ncbi:MULTISPECIES: polymer-forming cytoskeletal protein [Pseudoalteromonas]|uniref:Polymer-forming cytoskeletal protein n=2 Tax=Pseudoalteromonas TaxID=53246 RepID=A0A5S3USL9_9GAMM|nr:polymer-forming cytoskeletal protein [Pseudoalteromonas rubra]MCG7560700.1 polymer-forming cytoskeletal protein [Pseudoalteromonas sp. McH1-42]MEC4090643.1 polymer-forming cytoskeletal protein [Pseudoalteromonas rubra]QPB82566.1 polymer-forming cytoskeletal protein [Pseudoalteromonas rubra]
MFNKKKTSLPFSLISPDTEITGNIHCDGEIQIDGKVVGDLNVTQLIIGDSGIVEGNITAKQVQVRGQVQGGIRADSVTLEPSARVTGDIEHDTLTIQAGAHIQGQLNHRVESSNVTPLDKASEV